MLHAVVNHTSAARYSVRDGTANASDNGYIQSRDYATTTQRENTGGEGRWRVRINAAPPLVALGEQARRCHHFPQKVVRARRVKTYGDAYQNTRMRQSRGVALFVANVVSHEKVGSV